MFLGAAVFFSSRRRVVDSAQPRQLYKGLPSQMPAASAPSTIRLRFGLFELDPDAEELSKSGVRIRIQGQPFRILRFLAEHHGEIVTREELQRTLWKPDASVDLDRSLAAAIHKIRGCLDDSVTSPRFIETVSRSGYRFIAPVTEVRPEPVASSEPPRASPIPAISATDLPLPPTPTPSLSSQSAWPRRRLTPAQWAVAGVAAVAILVLLLRTGRGAPSGSSPMRALTRNASVALTGDMAQGYPGAVTDNARIYFPRLVSGRGEFAVVMLNGGDSTTIALPEDLGSPVADDVSPDGLRLLLRDRLSKSPEQALWVASPAGLTARQIPGVLAHDSAWMPDGSTILYANGNALFTVNDNGSGDAPFAILPGRPFRMRWSPDGRHLRLTLRDDRTLATTIWELARDGSGAHQILAGWHDGESVCCGTYLHQGGYVFQAGGRRNGSIWSLPDRDWLGRQATPFRLAEGPLLYSSPAAKGSGRSIVFTAFAPSFHLITIGAAGNDATPAPDFLAEADRLAFSADGQWVSWVRRDDGSLWRSHADGTNRVRVLGAPYEVFSMSWSPDASRLAVMAHRAGSPWRILLADLNSGHVEELLPTDNHNQADPQWTPDGKAIFFGRLPQRLAEPSLPQQLYRVDLDTRSVKDVPGSAGLFSPRLSPDGATLLALDGSQTSMRQLDLATGAWIPGASGHFDNPTFLSGGHAVVFHDFASSSKPLYRLDLSTHRITALGSDQQGGVTLNQPHFAGLLPGDRPVISVASDAADLYELEVPE